MNDRPDNLHDHSYSESTAVSRPQSVAIASSRASTSHDQNPWGNHDDAFELHQIETQEDDSPWSLSSGESRVITRRTRSHVDQRSISSQPPRKGLAGWVQRQWVRNVVMTVPENKNRDHFALERTFLAYIRTSVVLAMQGVLVAQLFRLQRESTPNDRLGYYEVGIPLSVSCHAVAILVAALGAYRFFKQQHAVALGKIYAGGWELNCIAGLFAAVILVTFILSLVIAVEIDMDNDNTALMA
ncbi:hypothetical protein BDW42DRAFT_166162 [Aspergillus taichungensis]|uniref:DUF202 domain-containing protein n=1 Tax=Aspergillus taichungensis TaxID=482145 RepID=A0A2J5HZ85_9EURO|nr:hypothetical protein BDW42DRAFT_166162 [Aspergillus taichungensis]